MDNLHVYRAKAQPATRYKVDMSDWVDGKIVPRHFVVKNPAQRVFRCFKCKKKHYAKNMSIQVYYDGAYLFCTPGKGCKAR